MPQNLSGALFLRLIAFVAVLATSPRGGAQVAAGEIIGLVKDQAGAAVPGASITVTETQTNRQRVVVSTRDGLYTAASLVKQAVGHEDEEEAHIVRGID